MKIIKYVFTLFVGLIIGVFVDYHYATKIGKRAEHFQQQAGIANNLQLGIKIKDVLHKMGPPQRFIDNVKGNLTTLCYAIDFFEKRLCTIHFDSTGAAIEIVILKTDYHEPDVIEKRLKR